MADPVGQISNLAAGVWALFRAVKDGSSLAQ